MAVILVSHGIPDAGFAALREAGHNVLLPKPLHAFSRQELLSLLPECEAFIAGGQLDAALIDSAPNLKIIANYGAGYDQVDWRYAATKGIPVTNIPETVTDSTAELAIGLMLSVCRRIAEMSSRLRIEPSGNLFGMGRLMGQTLSGLTLGIIGAGRIGCRTAVLAKAFGMHVIGYSRHGADPTLMEPVSLPALLRRADVISLHCPLTSETHHLIHADAIAHMKQGAVLINTARGAVVDTDALCDAIESGHLSGAGLDVYPDEPQIPQRLLQLPQVVLTPHIGANTEQTRHQMAEACSKQILDALSGKAPQHIVNGVLWRNGSC